MNVFLKFYDETKNMYVPPKFDEFKKVLASILNMPPENVKGLSLYYNDAEGDKIIIGVEDDYKEMYRQVANKEVTMKSNHKYKIILNNKLTLFHSSFTKRKFLIIKILR